MISWQIPHSNSFSKALSSCSLSSFCFCSSTSSFGRLLVAGLTLGSSFDSNASATRLACSFCWSSNSDFKRVSMRMKTGSWARQTQCFPQGQPYAEWLSQHHKKTGSLHCSLKSSGTSEMISPCWIFVGSPLAIALLLTQTPFVEMSLIQITAVASVRERDEISQWALDTYELLRTAPSVHRPKRKETWSEGEGVFSSLKA